ncbi:MAG: hypothetical protein JOY90_35220 [Bradyrhizobium sp.]|uniref:hypothetical protein n=1 Tax=Bradyrhizobium sp. TaxID=376 RepID=UPI001D64BE17|nr:hypothetical protein [Bradyrhizobium sp.]MBV9565666.1 hypothetical protein [Bradyrhizobium sp.]
MSSPRQDDADQERTSTEVPWTAASRPDEMYRRQMEVVAAASYLKRASKDTEPEKPARLPSFNLATPREDSFKLAETRQAWLQTLDPEMMPPPPTEQFKLPGFGTVTAVAAAVGVAAGIALAVTNSVRLPEPSTLLGGGDQASRNASFSSSVLADFTHMQKAEAKGQPGSTAVFTAAPVLAAVQPSDTEAAKSPIGVFAPLMRTEPAPVARTEPVPARTEPAKPEAVQPAAPEQAVTVTPAAPPSRATSNLSREEMATLFQRGRDLLNAGDIASARLILQHLAEAGSADACYALARTFDGNVLKDLGVIGAKPDALKARAWYERAAELGSAEAKQQLQQSAQR